MKNIKFIYSYKGVDPNNCSDIIVQLTNLVDYIIDSLFNNNLLPTELVDKNLGISLLLTNDEEIAKINQDWQKINRPTNVLSMGLFDFSQNDWRIFPDIVLGDIVISIDTAKKEAMEENIDLNDHILRLFIHGMLHIVGLDHQDEEDAKEMYKIEEDILAKLLVKVDGLTGNYWHNG